MLALLVNSWESWGHNVIDSKVPKKALKFPMQSASSETQNTVKSVLYKALCRYIWLTFRGTPYNTNRHSNIIHIFDKRTHTHIHADEHKWKRTKNRLWVVGKANALYLCIVYYITVTTTLLLILYNMYFLWVYLHKHSALYTFLIYPYFSSTS